MRFVISLVLATLVVAPVIAQEHATEEKAIREMFTQFEEAFNKYDAVMMASFYTPDADHKNAEGEVIARGRVEVQKMFEAAFAQLKADSSSQPLHATFSIRFLRSDVVILDGKTSKGPFTAVTTKEEGKWMIAAFR